ncbi:MAG TPA: phosphate signaling complex protein PhoU [Polyangia bacterium]|nr:phosphate signaling complex protein PhoU [Polyangia bacterium]
MTTTSLREHSSHAYEAELAAVRRKILEMGRQVDEVLEESGRALIQHDVELANSIILKDELTDDMELDIDHLCLEVLARRQPVAGDLRLLTSALKLVVDLERIGDLGVSIAVRVVELANAAPIVPYDEMLVMLKSARDMVSEALAALMTGDVERANRVIEMDDRLDAAYAHIFNQVITRMRDTSVDITNATRVQAVSKYIERIGDHATNLAERVIFVLTGEDVRHLPRARRTDLS